MRWLNSKFLARSSPIFPARGSQRARQYASFLTGGCDCAASTFCFLSAAGPAGSVAAAFAPPASEDDPEGGASGDGGSPFSVSFV